MMLNCIENTKEYLGKFVEAIREMSQLRERPLKLYNKDHHIPANKSNELSFYEKQLQLLKDIKKKQTSH